MFNIIKSKVPCLDYKKEKLENDKQHCKRKYLLLQTNNKVYIKYN